MSVAECELEEPSDLDWCATHNAYRPCRACSAEAQESRADAERDEMEVVQDGK